MYPATLADGLQGAGMDAHTVTMLGLRGSSDPEVFAAAVAGGYTILTENVGDFAQIAAEYSTAGGHHPGLLFALSSRFSRRPHGIEPLITAIRAVAAERFDDRIVYLERPDNP